MPKTIEVPTDWQSIAERDPKDVAAEIDRLRAALKKWLAYDNCEEADFQQAGPMLLYAEAIEATRDALHPL